MCAKSTLDKEGLFPEMESNFRINSAIIYLYCEQKVFSILRAVSV